MSYLLDTCALSEMIKKRPNAGFVEWIEQQKGGSLYVSVMSIAEIERGIVRLTDSRKKKRLRSWVSGIKTRYRSHLLPVDLGVAETYGQIQGNSMKMGKPLPVQDCWIAATAIAHSMAVVTRDDRPLSATSLVNPGTKTS
ncbi:MAG: type II toxin-antitoxin system VapC family toxin [Acidobacteria bacterium]|nr:type II toxin-antitoxin system VapC family toxin [Acidobacteriota bacterium]MCI0722892.1 type II toxin-antitoxin system VapC family toxin [Acidobacteriota bacterium]